MKNPSDGMRTASRNAFEACGRRGGRGNGQSARRRRPVLRRLHAGFNRPASARRRCEGPQGEPAADATVRERAKGRSRSR
jgi:hypothetical protein